jgi:DUF1680 family protein
MRSSEHLHDNSQLDWHLEDGPGWKVVQKTVTPAKPTDFALYLRVPGRSASTQVTIHGQPVSGATPGRYLDLRRHWSSGDTIIVKVSMTSQVIEA